MENLKNKFTLAVLSLLALLAITVASVPTLKMKFHSLLESNERIILAKVMGPITQVGPVVKVIKLKEKSHVIVEIYLLNIDEQNEKLISSFSIDNNQDGFINTEKNATNLALIDVDNDNSKEIVVPSFDQNMVPRLHVYKYNLKTQSFDRLMSDTDRDTDRDTNRR